MARCRPPSWSPRLLPEATVGPSFPCCRSELGVSPCSAVSTSENCILHTRLARPVTPAQGWPCSARARPSAGLQVTLCPRSALPPRCLGGWHVLASQGSGATEPLARGPAAAVAVWKCRGHPLVPDPVRLRIRPQVSLSPTALLGGSRGNSPPCPQRRPVSCAAAPGRAWPPQLARAAPTAGAGADLARPSSLDSGRMAPLLSPTCWAT